MNASVLLQRLLLSLTFAVIFTVTLRTYAQQSTDSDASHPTHNTSNVAAPRVDYDTIATIKKNGKLRVGVAEIVPWAMHDKDGKLIGFSIDVARKLARDLGVEVEFHPVTFKYLISDLLADRYDIIISGFSIEPERAILVNFSDPYNTTDVTLAVNTKTAGQYRMLKDFNKSNFTIGALEGTTAEEMASKLLPEANLKTYDSDAELFNDIIKGKLDVAAADYPRPEIVAKLFPAAVTSPPTIKLATFPSAFAVRRGDHDFINYLNSWIASRTANQWLADRRTYWFNTLNWTKMLE
jgi:polar amino acid transport system substrate-binding protein